MGANKKTFMEDREKLELAYQESENHKELVSECKRYLVEVVVHMEEFPNQYRNYMHIWKAGLDMSGLMNDIKEY